MWVFVLELLGNGSTRLIIRSWMDYHPRAALAEFFLLFEPAVFVMERTVLWGIKQRAEKTMHQAGVAGVENGELEPSGSELSFS